MNDLGNVSPLLALAELMLNTDELRAKADEDALRAAHQAQQQALNDEVRALHEAAADTRLGAWVEGAATVAGGAAAATAYGLAPGAVQPTGGAGALLKSGEALERMAAPMGRELGEAPSQDAQADAKHCAQEAADAGATADLANRHRDRLLDAEARTLGTVESILESEAQGNWALLANV